MSAKTHRLLTKTRHIIVGLIDFVHRPFERWIPTQTFRYLACGGTNTLLNIFLYYISYNFILHQQDVHVYHNVKITGPVAAYIMAFCVSFPIGFFLSRHIVFPESNLHGRVQFFRYGVVTMVFITLNYLFLKLFVEICHFYPTLAYTLTTIIVAVCSYISQRLYTFKIKIDEPLEEDIIELAEEVPHDY